MKARHFVVVSFLFAVQIWSQTQKPQIQTLKVQSAWGGLGQPAHSAISIQRQGGSYRTSGRTIPADLVDAFLSAVQTPALDVPMPANLGITSGWLHQYADQAGAHTSRLFYNDGLPEQKALFREAFEEQRTLPSRLKQVYDSRHTDDYPHIRVQLMLQDGAQVTLTTDSQIPTCCLGA